MVHIPQSFPYYFIMPYGQFGVLWRVAVVILVLLQAITIPLEVGAVGCCSLVGCETEPV